jgi:lipopolysaccharide export system protein LptA
MAKSHRKKLNLIELRARLPLVLRWLALAALGAVVIFVAVGFYRGRGNKDFRLQSELAKLSKDVVGEVSGYERRETENGVAKYYIRADRAVTFADNHQELDNVYLEIYGEGGAMDKLSAQRGVYIPEAGEGNKFKLHFFGAVDIETRDTLKIKSEQISYDRGAETAETEELISFSRENLSGKATGAKLDIAAKRLELLKDVEFESVARPGESNSGIERAKLLAGHAVIEQTEGKATLTENIQINVTPAAGSDTQPAEIKSGRAIAYFEHSFKKAFKKAELFENVRIAQGTADARLTVLTSGEAVYDTSPEVITVKQNVEITTNGSAANQTGSAPTTIRAAEAVYTVASELFTLRQNVEIVTNGSALEQSGGNAPTTIRAAEAVYRQREGKVFLTNNAEITQNGNLVKGDAITADLDARKKLQKGAARGNAYLKTTGPAQNSEVYADQIDVDFGANQQPQLATASGGVRVKSSDAEGDTNFTSANTLTLNFASGGGKAQLEKLTSQGASAATMAARQPKEYSTVSLFAPNSLEVFFRQDAGRSVVQEMRTGGRTTVTMTAPENGGPKAANRKLIADAVKTFWNASGKDLSKTEAVGNAEFYVEPTQPAPENYNSRVTAGRFNCDFYPAGNLAKICVATGKAKAEMRPTQPSEVRQTRNLSATKLIANFDRSSQDIQRFDAAGGAKFNEGDRYALAANFTYTAGDEIVQLRGGEPLVWDSRARARGAEIDWDMRNDRSFVTAPSTTYYTQGQTNGATPFAKTNAPVFITADRAEFDHRGETASYIGNARAWQENNFVRADRLTIRQKEKQLNGEGRVQSQLYNAKRKDGTREANIPVFVTAGAIAYSDEARLLRYTDNVDIRQGTDRITGGVADINLNENNEVQRTVIEKNVNVTQPGKRARGDWAQYTTADETVILRGNPATVEDAAQGSTKGAQITVNMRDSRVVNNAAVKPAAPGRIRSIYKVKKQ